MIILLSLHLLRGKDVVTGVVKEVVVIGDVLEIVVVVVWVCKVDWVVEVVSEDNNNGC